MNIRSITMGLVTAAMVAASSEMSRAADLTDQQVARILARADRAAPVDPVGRDLSFLDLAGLDFKAARLDGAYLHAVDFANADLSNAKLSGAHLDRATVQKTNFSGADMRGASLLRPSVTTELELNMKSVADAPNFAGADLTGARIFGRLNGANLRGADLTGARLGHYRLTVIELHPMTFLELADLSGAKLRRADLVGVQFSWAKFVGADLSGANLTNANLTGADLTGADLTGANLTGTDLNMTILRDVKGLDQAIGYDRARNGDQVRRSILRAVAVVLLGWVMDFSTAGPVLAADPRLDVDTALVLSVDVSSSVNEERFRLQMEGIAQALEDPAIQRAILGGPRGAILVTLVQWADRQNVTIPWMRVAGVTDARRLAAMIRNAPRRPGDFTCAAAMLHFIGVKVLPGIPGEADRIVVDVSGDGRDNCNPVVPPSKERDAIVALDGTVNGLPILEGEEAGTLEDWYAENIAGGPASFVQVADGYKDFGRAIRHKFLTEISWR